MKNNKVRSSDYNQNFLHPETQNVAKAEQLLKLQQLAKVWPLVATGKKKSDRQMKPTWKVKVKGLIAQEAEIS